MIATTLAACIALAGLTTPNTEVAHYSARNLTKGIVTPGSPIAAQIETAARIAGELGLDGWVSDEIYFFTQAPRAEAREHLEVVRSVVRDLAPVTPQDGGAVPLFVYHVATRHLYAQLIDRFATAAPECATFLGTVGELCGVALPGPHYCAVVDDNVAMPLLRHKNLLAHLCAHTQVEAVHGALPQWLREGLALDAEQRIAGSLFAFCDGRKREPPTKECRWADQLDEAWSGTGAAAIERLFASDEREMEEAAAVRAMSSVRWLREAHPEAFALAVRRIAEAIAGSEVTDPAARAKSQDAIFVELLGQGYVEEWLRGARTPAKKGRRT